MKSLYRISKLFNKMGGRVDVSFTDERVGKIRFSIGGITEERTCVTSQGEIERRANELYKLFTNKPSTTSIPSINEDERAINEAFPS